MQGTSLAVLVRAGGAVCAIPLGDVVETMRPLPTTPLAGAPTFVSGVTVARGEPVPVVDLGRFLGCAPGGQHTRFVILRAGSRRYALAVSSVIGVVDLDEAFTQRLPLLAESCQSSIEAVGARDEELMVLVRAVRVVPAEVWATLPGGSVPP